MPNLVERFAQNPLLSTKDIPPSREDWLVECVLNPGAFEYKGKIGLLLRVAERPPQKKGWLSTPVLDASAKDGVRVVSYRKSDKKLSFKDPRVFNYDGTSFLTTLSHLRLAWSDDGVNFVVEKKPALIGVGPLETYGIEDCRVTQIGSEYHLTFTAVSADGHGVGYITTRDWKRFTRHGMILPSPNKDCAILPRKIGKYYYALHRPSGMGIGGNYIWTARSLDLLHWGDHHCIAQTRRSMWDCQRIGAGASPIETSRGWLEIYHGANNDSRYSLGLLLLDRNDPTRVLARSKKPILEPKAKYELTGFFGNVVFTNGHIVDGDKVTIYYGASDEVICAGTTSIKALLATLD